MTSPHAPEEKSYVYLTTNRLDEDREISILRWQLEMVLKTIHENFEKKAA